MKEYHIDGFRFDLGHLIDWDTIELIKREAEKVNPGVFITCEPWGGGYDPNGFSDRGWSSWNDQFSKFLMMCHSMWVGDQDLCLYHQLGQSSKKVYICVLLFGFFTARQEFVFTINDFKSKKLLQYFWFGSCM